MPAGWKQFQSRRLLPFGATVAEKPNKSIVRLEDVLTAMSDWIASHCPSKRPTWITITLDDGESIRVPFAEVSPDASGWTLSPDQRTLTGFGQSHALSTNQGKAVSILLDAMKAGHRDVSGAFLLTEAESDSPRVRDLFRSSSLWTERLIMPGEAKGSYRLLRPDEVE